MIHLEHKAFAVGLVAAISLFATVVSLLIQRIFYPSPVLALIGPILAVTTVILYSNWRPDVHRS
jgi:hypothetical protein